MDAMYTIIGIVALYTTGHFFFLQVGEWKNRTAFEKAITVIAMMSISLIYIGVLTE